MPIDFNNIASVPENEPTVNKNKTGIDFDKIPITGGELSKLDKNILLGSSNVQWGLSQRDFPDLLKTHTDNVEWRAQNQSGWDQLANSTLKMGS